MERQQRLIVVANRLPLQRVAGEWETSPGGLVSALAPILREREGSWVGWTGIAGFAPDPFVHDGIEQRPVYISKPEVEDFYLGFCNGTLWPLYHDAVRTPEFHRHWWRPYAEVNRRFADETASATKPGDLVWVQDYQLQLVPGYLRHVRADLTIGFFLHIPFPPVELFAQLPWRRQILEGLLGADVVAFQTRLGKQNFARAAIRFAGATGNSTRLELGGRVIRLLAAPISIDTRHYEQLASEPTVAARADALRADLGQDRRLILGVDRLDYTKGIDIRLRAFEALLQHQPELAPELVFVQVAVPSREGIGEYAQMRADIEQLTGRINGAFGEPGRMPVHYLYRSLPSEDLVAYYRAADIMCVTPLRDGMNLVAKEYVASRPHNSGVLVLSEFAGAAQELRQALLVNPHDVDGLAATLHRAVKMPAEEAAAHMAGLRRAVRRNDVFAWARRCLEAMSE